MSHIQPEVLSLIEEAVAKYRPFGETENISNELEVSYERRLNSIAPRLPIAGKLLLALESISGDARYRFFGNTVVRCAIQHARTQIEAGAEYGLPLADCEKVFGAALSHI